MATLRQRIAAAERYTLSDYAQWKSVGNASFPIGSGSLPGGFGTGTERVDGSFEGYVQGIYRKSGVVFACMAIRQAIFAEVTFKYRNKATGDLFGDTSLEPLERPWPNGTTGELATRMIQDVDIAGNFYAVRRGNRLYRRQPDKMSILLSGDPLQEELVDVVGYLYQPNGAGGPASAYRIDEVCHWSPTPDPLAEYMGMSWLTPILREIEADSAATDHKSTFFRNGATPQFAVTMPEDVMTAEQFEDFRTKMVNAHAGTDNAYKTLWLAPGADLKTVGLDLKQMSFDDTQGRDETRIASAAGVPAVLVGIKESLQGSSLNAGNYLQARRRMADVTMRPLYRSGAAALETLVSPPPNAQLWHDDSGVAFFREDRHDAATIQGIKATSIRTLVDAGYTPDSVQAAVDAEDNRLLKHSGLFSVQLQPANSQPDKPATRRQTGPLDLSLPPRV